MERNTKLLIDADSIIYKAGCSNETREYHIEDPSGYVVHTCQYHKDAMAYIQGDPDLTPVMRSYAGDLSHSLAGAKFVVNSILDNVPHSTYQLYIGGDGNFRHELYPEYKANRSGMLRPIHEQEIREYLTNRFRAEVVHGEEADDRVSYTQCADIGRTCIVGVDKDLWNTPGWHYNYGKDVLEYVELPDADYNFWVQMLKGDTSDNIPCLKGVGDKSATNLLASVDHKDYKDVVLSEYLSRGYSLDYFILMGRLLWMRRKPNELWTP
jgi:hypothetical protein